MLCCSGDLASVPVIGAAGGDPHDLRIRRYKDQLRLVALPMRLGGLVGVMIGCALLIASTKFPNALFVPLGLAAVLGWGVTGYALAAPSGPRPTPYTGPR